MATTVDYEFSGPYLGPIGVIIGLPALCYILAWLTDRNRRDFLELKNFLTPRSFAVIYGYFFLVVLLHLILPGKRVKGVVLENGSQLTYKLNGIYVFMFIYWTLFCLSFVKPILDISWLHLEWTQLLTASVSLSFLLSISLYIKSYKKNALLSRSGQTGKTIYDFFMGRELNPRIFNFDLKEFCELYPGLIGWTILNLGMCYKQLKDFGYVSSPLMALNIFQFIYVLDGLYYESAILNTMDITTDGFGFMLAFGDLTWVPFIYSIQAKYLAEKNQALPPLLFYTTLLLKAMGYVIFRYSNSQKYNFKFNPDHSSVRHLKYILTKDGRKLLISGWWGLARHINYTGDWLMGLSWCMLTGHNSVIPYFYAIYFLILLVHRDFRDNHACLEKYGPDWKLYCTLVPYRFIPYIF